MSVTALTFPHILGIITVFGHVGIFVFAGVVLLRHTRWGRFVIAHVGRYALWLGFGASFMGIAFSLLYSNVIGLVPCELCWWQRIFLYPQVVLFGALLVRPHISTLMSAVVLAVCGLFTGMYHSALQTISTLPTTCVIGGVSDCSQTQFEVAGYVTFPVMSTTVFAFLLIVSAVYLLREQRGWYDTIKAFVVRWYR